MVSTSRYEAQDVAKAADVAPAFVSRLVELGVVPPDQDGGFSSGDVRRIRLMKTLDRAGVPLDGVAQEFVARELTGYERVRYFQRAVEMYPGFLAYRRWAAARKIPVLLLEPVS